MHYPVVDATGLEGGWDLSYSFSLKPPASQPGATPFNAPAGTEISDPTGGTSLFNTFEKQLGLKLEAQKRSYPTFVIDHIEKSRPTIEMVDGIANGFFSLSVPFQSVATLPRGCIVGMSET